MALGSWECKYGGSHAVARPPDPLLVETARAVPAGRALDLACGTGRNALWLAQQGWTVTAVDGASSAITTLRARAADQNLSIDAHVADLEKGNFVIAAASWDLIAVCYYLQRDLYERAKRGLVPGGLLVAIALMVEPGKEHSAYRVQPGELRSYFAGWDVLHYREGADASHGAVAEIGVRRPLLP